jgi:hypothetical protein
MKRQYSTSGACQAGCDSIAKSGSGSETVLPSRICREVRSTVQRGGSISLVDAEFTVKCARNGGCSHRRCVSTETIPGWKPFPQRRLSCPESRRSYYCSCQTLFSHCTPMATTLTPQSTSAESLTSWSSLRYENELLIPRLEHRFPPLWFWIPGRV